MLAPLPTPDEAQRLAVLRSYDILDTEPQEAFDRLARLAAKVVGTPIALISLVDSDRQWFKARVGLTLGQTPRCEAFCAHAINQDEPLVIPDAAIDPRFSDNPLVVGPPHVRFYAGAQLTSPSGHQLGTLCAIDVRPRHISEDQLRHLSDLAAAVVTTMELQRTLRTLEQRALTDDLTGLSNRVRLGQLLDAQCHTAPDAFVPFSLLYLGCDDLKEVNDTLGRETGDRLLRTLARALPEWVRPTDTAARVDGDEFALLLPATPEVAALTVADRVLESSTAIMLRNAWTVMLSIGAATFLAPPSSADLALSVAETAMHTAKLRGKRQIRAVRFPDTAGVARLPPLGVMQQALRSGIDRDELFLEYQPIVPIGPDTDAASARSVEALVRWRHPTLGVLPPLEFIPGAERSGLILPLGDAVLAMALRQMRAWIDAGSAPARVCVNVSALQLRAPDFAPGVLKHLDRMAVPPDRLMVELTEGTLIDGGGVVRDTLTALVGAGVRLAIDDFGTGYSSLRYLRELPVHTLKIDRSFITDIASNPRDVSIVAAIVAMARTLRLATVAEGIETEAQREVLARLGCDFGQGWLFGRPA